MQAAAAGSPREERRARRDAVRIVAALFCLTFAVYGASIYAFIIVAQPMAREFGWSPVRTGGLVSAMWLAAPLALFVGAATRRYGGWTLAACGLAIQAAALAGMSLADDFGQVYLLRVVMGVGKVVTICAVPVVLASWVTTGFATAMAVVWAGGSAGGLVMAPLAGRLVDALGWRDAAIAIGALVTAIAALALLVLRPRGPPTAIGAADPTPDVGDGMLATLRGLPRLTGAVMFVSVIGVGIVGVGLISVQPALYQRAGLPTDVAAMLLGLSAACSFVGSATIGILYDRLRPRTCGLAVLTALAIGLLSLRALPDHPVAMLGVAAAAGTGYTLGAGESLWIILTRMQFGTKAFPVVYGLWFLALQLGYGSGGWITGWALDELSGDAFLLLLVLLYAPAGASTLLLRGGRRREAAA